VVEKPRMGELSRQKSRCKGWAVVFWHSESQDTDVDRETRTGVIVTAGVAGCLPFGALLPQTVAE
jgi:hypothetical protein